MTDYDPKRPFAEYFKKPEPALSQPGKKDGPPPPLCVWCSAPWTDDMMKVYADADISWGDYGGLDGIEVTIDVTCSTCNRLVYQKHVADARY